MVKAHLGVGILFTLLFLATGVYMLVSFPELYGEREEVRMMYRASHIYLLMSALMNLMAANRHDGGRSQSCFPRLANVASILLLITPFLFVAAFVTEPASYAVERPITFWAVVMLFAAVVLRAAEIWLGPLITKRG